MHLPARNAVGINEILVILQCLIHYKKRGLDPGYQDFYEEKYTIEGARIAILKKNRPVSPNLVRSDSKSLLNSLRIELEKILQIINK